jgi:hypothetical protein
MRNMALPARAKLCRSGSEPKVKLLGTDEDKRKAVKQLLAVLEWSQWSIPIWYRAWVANLSKTVKRRRPEVEARNSPEMTTNRAGEAAGRTVRA